MYVYILHNLLVQTKCTHKNVTQYLHFISWKIKIILKNEHKSLNTLK